MKIKDQFDITLHGMKGHCERRKSKEPLYIDVIDDCIITHIMTFRIIRLMYII